MCGRAAVVQRAEIRLGRTIPRRSREEQPEDGFDWLPAHRRAALIEALEALRTLETAADVRGAPVHQRGVRRYK